MSHVYLNPFSGCSDSVVMDKILTPPPLIRRSTSCTKIVMHCHYLSLFFSFLIGGMTMESCELVT